MPSRHTIEHIIINVISIISSSSIIINLLHTTERYQYSVREGLQQYSTNHLLTTCSHYFVFFLHRDSMVKNEIVYANEITRKIPDKIRLHLIGVTPLKYIANVLLRYPLTKTQ